MKFTNLCDKVKSRIKIDKVTGCWTWQGGWVKPNLAYGRVWFDGKLHLTHHGCISIPSGKEVHHKCKNTLCLNPDHLKVVTRLEHRIAEGRSDKNVFTSCGHLKTEENTYVHKPTGNKFCRICNTERHKQKRRSKSLFVNNT